MPQPITITIGMRGGSISVHPDWPVLRRSLNQTVKWKMVPSNKTFLVCFGNRSPFSKKHFHNLRPGSGAIRVRVPSGMRDYFKYSVEVGNKTLDPGIIIKE